MYLNGSPQKTPYVFFQKKKYNISNGIHTPLPRQLSVTGSPAVVPRHGGVAASAAEPHGFPSPNASGAPLCCLGSNETLLSVESWLDRW